MKTLILMEALFVPFSQSFESAAKLLSLLSAVDWTRLHPDIHQILLLCYINRKAMRGKIMGPKNCKICEEAQSKYKCPNCFIPYCSLVCFKKHKEILCVKPEPELEPFSEEKPTASAPASHVEKPIYVDDPSEVLNQSQLESIASSSEIREAMRNKELQNLIYNLDSSVDAEAFQELDKAMGKEEFRIVSEKILSMISQ